ncbi:hemolysin secretion protein D [Aureimonas sp. SA4125]|uniref:efflux RND transporter periplasmic adaptor subunit n=1 Tax=Aureimonas sp. SA4125 TaxID=2826993 RepID=UPI001CC34808|nr:efflux RND transporter periplasmic adaptor subunit [Aureimonas sp. SA4125]BDA84654.1 hemolysin secretion protein D [Aureimonas sp. SA4125]
MRLLYPLPLVLVLLAGCQSEEPAPAPVVRPVKSVLVEPFGQQPLTFSGSVEPQVSTDVSFQILGRMVDRRVNVGDIVAAGAVLATLDASVQEQNVQAAEAALASAEASLSNATGVASRQRALQASRVATQATVDEAEQSLQSTRSAVLQARSALDKAREQLGYARLTAGAPGIVTAVSAEAGQVVSPGQTVVTIARPDLRDAVVDLPDRLAATLKRGAPLRVQLELDPDVTAEGTVREIAPLADAVTRARRVKIALIDPPEGFRLGSIVKVALTGGEAKALALPASAILRRDGESFVWVILEGSDTVTLRPVAVREEADGRLAVLDGLKAGERVAAAGANTLTDGQRVKIEETAR